MRRLHRPRGRRRIVRVEARHVEREHRVDDADAKHLGPEQVHGGARKLRVGREHPGEFRSRMLCGIRPLAREHVDRIQDARRPAPIHTNHRTAGRVVAGALVVDRVLVLGGADFGAAQHVGPAEERRHPPDLVALPLAEIEVDLLEMTGAVVARSAADVDAQEILGRVDRQLVGRVFVHLVVAGHGGDHPTGDVGGRAVVPVRRGIRRQHLGDDFVVRPVQMNVVVNPAVEEVLRLVADPARSRLVDVVEEVRPLRLVRLGDGQSIDELVALIGIVRCEKGSQVFVVRRPAGQIDVQPPEEFSVGRQPGVRDAILFHFAEDEFVDQVLARYWRGLRVCARRPKPFGQIRHSRPAVWRRNRRVILRQLRRLSPQSCSHEQQQATKAKWAHEASRQWARTRRNGPVSRAILGGSQAGVKHQLAASFS